MRKRYRLTVCLLILSMLAGFINIPQNVQAADVVSTRTEQVKKVYKNKSKINEIVHVTTFTECDGQAELWDVENGGCNALVAYYTLKVFHNAYVPGACNYKQIGKTAKTTSKSAMKTLFKKAKKGDVIRWHSGDKEYHFAIFLSDNSKGIRVYEGNFGKKNTVYYNHQWNWGNMKSWAHGAKQVSLYRSKNYNQVQKKKAAINLKKGDTFEVNGIIYSVTKTGMKYGNVKVVEKDETAGETPKAVGVNYDTASYLEKEMDSIYSDPTYIIETEDYDYNEYFKMPKDIYDEQLFKVVK